MEWTGASAQRGPHRAARSPERVGSEQPVEASPSVAFTLRDFAWFIGGGIVVSAFITAFLVALLVDWQSRFLLWKAERDQQTALQEIAATSDKWALALTQLGATRDTVNLWRKYVPRSVGGRRP